MAEIQIVPSIGPLGVVAGILLTLMAGLLVEQLVHFLSWRLQRSATSVAAIFAPLITSTPELAIFTVALLTGQPEIAWGSIVAQPFMVATLLFPVVTITALGAWALGKRRYKLPHVHRAVTIPLIVFTVPLVPILLLHPEKYGLYGKLYGLVLVALYFIYARFTLREEVEVEHVAHLWLRSPALQIVVAIVAMFFGAEWMVSGITELGTAVGLDKLALSIILVPIASVIPESIVGLIFIAKGKDDEGVSAIVGETALYGTFYPGLAMALGVYALEPAAVTALTLAVVMCILGTIAIWYGYFSLAAPIGLAGYIYYVMCYTFGAACPTFMP